jgi:hypothetical protein
VIDAALRVVKLHSESERKIRDVRERVTWLDCERCENRKNLGLEKLVNRLPLGGGEIVHSNESDSVLLERREQKIVQAVARVAD